MAVRGKFVAGVLNEVTKLVFEFCASKKLNDGVSTGWVNLK